MPLDRKLLLFRDVSRMTLEGRNAAELAADRHEDMIQPKTVTALLRVRCVSRFRTEAVEVRFAFLRIPAASRPAPMSDQSNLRCLQHRVLLGLVFFL